LVDILENLLICTRSCSARSLTSLDTSASTNSVKQPSVHAVLISVGPSCAISVQVRADSSSITKKEYSRKKKVTGNSAVDNGGEHEYGPRRACHAMT
jgi:hypothetical protein